MSSAISADVVVVGGGIVGMATAWKLLQEEPSLRVTVVEKESKLGQHQTGNNSGVIHSGLYYKPGGLKAKFAIAGSRSMVEFCETFDVPHKITGKLVVATDDSERAQLEMLFERGQQHGLHLRKLSPVEVEEYEPHVQAVAGFHVPSTGIVDYSAVIEVLKSQIEAMGGQIASSTRVIGVERVGPVCRIETDKGHMEASFVIGCAGLQSDRLALASQLNPEFQIVPFRGEYFELVPERRHLVSGLIYPVPDPRFPFLGVHFTRGIDGSVHCGPNAVLALAREGYRKRDISLDDVREIAGFPGFWRLARRHWNEGAQEMWRSFSKRAFVKSLQALIPEITMDDVVPTNAGVRAQALRPDGTLVDDFLLVEAPGMLHVCNAPSPAATASLEIGAHIAQRYQAMRAGSAA